MCVQSLIALWCPCKEHTFDKRNPGPDTWDAFRGDAEGHIITRLVFTGAYIWCDDYVRSPSFAASFHANPPNCPNGSLETEYEHYRSRTLCADCMGQSCSVPTEGSSAYYAGPHELIAASMAEMSTRLANLEKDTITGDAEKPKSSQKPKKDKIKSNHKSKSKAKTDGTPLRVIDLREDDAADIALLKAQRTARKGKMKAIDNFEDQNSFRQPSVIAKDFLSCPIDMNPIGRKTLPGRIGEKPRRRIAPVLSPEDLAELNALPLLVLGKDKADKGNNADNED